MGTIQSSEPKPEEEASTQLHCLCFRATVQEGEGATAGWAKAREGTPHPSKIIGEDRPDHVAPVIWDVSLAVVEWLVVRGEGGRREEQPEYVS